MGIECAYNDKDMLERGIIDIIESDDRFVAGEFPLDGDARNYKIFLNSYKMEKQRKEAKRVRDFFRRGAYENGFMSEKDFTASWFV